MALFNYSKPGPGVDKGETNKNRFFYFWELYFRKFWKLMELNLLYLLCCVPIVTIGPATAGMVYVLRNYADIRSTFLVYDFFQAFKKNFLQSVALFFIDLPVTALAGYAFYFYMGLDSKLKFLPMGISLMVILLVTFMRFYAYLMVVTVDLKLKHILKNAFIFAFVGFKTNILSLVFSVLVLAIAFVLLPYGYLILGLIAFSTIGFIQVYNSYPYIVKYIVAPFEEREGIKKQEEEAVFTDIGSKERTAKTPPKGRVIR